MNALLLHRFQQFRETRVRIVAPFFHAALECNIMVGNRLENGLSGKPGPATGQGFQGERFETYMSCCRQPFELKGVDDALGRADFMIDAMKAVFVAIRVLIEKAPQATR